MKSIFCAFFFIVFLIPQSAFSQQIYSIKGIVRDSESGLPVPNVNIVVQKSYVGTSSDKNGYFELKLAEGEYALTISSIGYSEKIVPVRIPTKEPEQMRIELMPLKQELEGVDVFGSYFLTGRDTSIERIPVSILPAVTTIHAVEIEKQGAVTLIEALKYVPGGWTETRGRKTKQFFSVRGQKYPYPDYSINGIWQKEFEETGYFLSALDIESIEIVRSASALVKGLSGLTGVVDVKTKMPERETLSLLAKYGEQNNMMTNVQYGNKNKEISYNASASFFGTDGPSGRNGKERISNMYGNIHWNITPKLNLMAGATYINGMRQLVRIEEETGAPNIKNRIEQYDPMRTLLSHVKMSYIGVDGSQTELQLNLSYRDVDFTTYNIPQQSRATQEENDWEYGINLLHSRKLSKTNTLRVGGLYNHWVAPEGKRYYVGRRGDVHTYSGVIADEQKIGRFLFDAGFRIIGGYIEEWGGFGIEGSAAGFQNVAPIENQAAPWEWQSVLGVTYALTGFATLHYNFSGGTIAPRKGSLTDEGVLPENEKRFQHDLGFRYITPGKNEIAVSSFFTERKNSIDFSGQTVVSDNDLVMELYENVDRNSYGMELSAKINIPFLHSYFFGNALLMKGNKQSIDQMEADEQLPMVIVNSGVYFDLNGWDANLFANYTGSYSNNRFVIPSWVQQHGDFPLGDFLALDFTAGYTVHGKFKKRIFVEVKNFMDKNFMTVAGYPDPGRIFMAGIRIFN